MGNSQINNELEAIKALIHRHKEGASIDDILASGLNIELRTLQRRLAKLQKQGEIILTGQTRSLRYHLAVNQKTSSPTDLLPLSQNGKYILNLVSKPVQQRKPVSYNRLFLEQYIPNATSYLTSDEKAKLSALGKTLINDQPAGTYAKEILQRLLIDLSWNSSRMEGNTYSLLDTERLLSSGEAMEGKTRAEAQMILNHKDAIEFIVQGATQIDFNRYTLLNLHALLANDLLPNPAAAGRLRSMEVLIGQSVYIPLAMPQLVDELFELMLHKARQIQNPFEQAFFIMVQLPYLQPFDDVNKRVSRLAANISLNRHNLAPLSFVDVPNDLYVQGIKGVYELNDSSLLKDVFLWAYERSSARYAAIRQSLGEPDPFRMKYRNERKEIISRVVGNALPRPAAAAAIKDAAKQIPVQDQHRFIEVVETELMSLHEGNFARYWVSPFQFSQWSAVWQGNDTGKV